MCKALSSLLALLSLLLPQNSVRKSIEQNAAFRQLSLPLRPSSKDEYSKKKSGICSAFQLTAFSQTSAPVLRVQLVVFLRGAAWCSSFERGEVTRSGSKRRVGTKPSINKEVVFSVMQKGVPFPIYSSSAQLSLKQVRPKQSILPFFFSKWAAGCVHRHRPKTISSIYIFLCCLTVCTPNLCTSRSTAIRHQLLLQVCKNSKRT